MASDIRSAACSVSPSPNRTRSGRSSACPSIPGSAKNAAARTTSTPRNHKEKEHDLERSVWCNALEQMGDLELLPHDDSLLSEPELDFEFQHNRNTMDILSAVVNLDKRRSAHGGYGTPSSYASEQEMDLYFANRTPVSELQFDSVDDSASHLSGQTGLQTIALLENKMKDEIIHLETKERPKIKDEQTTEEHSIVVAPTFLVDQNIEENKAGSVLANALQRCGTTVKKLEKLANSSLTRYSYCDLQKSTVQEKSSSNSDIENTSFQSEHELYRRNSDSALTRKAIRRKKRKTRSKFAVKPENRLFRMIKSASETLIDRDVSDVMIHELTTPDVSQVESEGKDISGFNSFQEYLKELRSLDHVRMESSDHLSLEKKPPRQSTEEHNLIELAVIQPQTNWCNLSDFDSFQECVKELRSLNHPATKPITKSNDNIESRSNSLQSYDLEEMETPTSVASASSSPVSVREEAETQNSNLEDVEEDTAVEFLPKTKCVEMYGVIAGNMANQLDHECHSDKPPSFNDDNDSPQDKVEENAGELILSDSKDRSIQQQTEEPKYIAMTTDVDRMSPLSKGTQGSSNKGSYSPIYFEKDQDVEPHMLTARRKSDDGTTIGILYSDDLRNTKESCENDAKETENSCAFQSPTEINEIRPTGAMYYHANDATHQDTHSCDDSEKSLPNFNAEICQPPLGVEDFDMSKVNGIETVLIKGPACDIKYVEQAGCDSGTESGYGTTNESKPKVKQQPSFASNPNAATHCYLSMKQSPIAVGKKAEKDPFSSPTPCAQDLPTQQPSQKETMMDTVNSTFESVEKPFKAQNSETTAASPKSPITYHSSAIAQELSLFDVKASVLDSRLKTYEEWSPPSLSKNVTEDPSLCLPPPSAKTHEDNVKLEVNEDACSDGVSSKSCSKELSENLQNVTNNNMKEFCDDDFKPTQPENQLVFDGYGDPIPQIDFTKYSDYYSLSPPNEKQKETGNINSKPQKSKVVADISRNKENKSSSQPLSRMPSIIVSSAAERITENCSDLANGSKVLSLHIQPEIGTYALQRKDTHKHEKAILSKPLLVESKHNEYVPYTSRSPAKKEQSPNLKNANDFPTLIHHTVPAEVESDHKTIDITNTKEIAQPTNKSFPLEVYSTELQSYSKPEFSHDVLQSTLQQRVSITDDSTQPQHGFPFEFQSKYKNLEEQIERILNPTPSPPPTLPRSSSAMSQDYSDFAQKAGYLSSRKPDKSQRKVRFDDSAEKITSARTNKSMLGNLSRVASKPSVRTQANHRRRDIFKDFHAPRDISLLLKAASEEPFATSSSSMASSDLKNHESSRELVEASDPEEYNTIAETLQFIRENLNRDDNLVKQLEMEIQQACERLLEVERCGLLGKVWHDEKMSSGTRIESGQPTKVRALEEVVNLLKKHVKQREVEINGLGGQLRHSNERIMLLEKKLNEKNHDKYHTQGLRQDDTLKKLQLMQAERDELKKRIRASQTQKEDAQKASRKAHHDLELEKENRLLLSGRGIRDYSDTRKQKSIRQNDVRVRADESEYLNQSSSSDLEKREDLESLKRENRSLRSNNDQSVLDLQTDNTIMREKLDRMNEISAENLLLQSDAADFQAELAELRSEAKELRTRCYELNEENRQCKAEIRDLRRYIELLKSNKTGDSRQDLLNKIEYYQMEHDRLLDEVRRLKHRLGEVSPRSPRSPRSRPISPPRPRAGSPKSSCHASYPGPSSRNTTQNVRFSRSLERGRSPVTDAMAASCASSHAAVRLVKDRSLSPAVALNIRDLTMDRYHQHMDGPESPRSMDSDCTEMLLKPQTNGNGYTSLPSAIAPLHSDDDDDDVELDLPNMRNGKLSDSIGSNHGGMRSASKDSLGPCRRSCSPTNPGGFRSVSPKMTSTQKPIHDTARDRYPTKIKRSLPRRAFAPRSPADLMLGYSIKFTRPGGRLSRGTVKYIGHLPTRDEIFIGVELDGYDGKHSGTFQGTKYFTCPTNKGIFTPFSKVIMAWE